ncbi:MAG: ABC transporter substrate-binding protein [Desulfovibrionaceae bacterium]
MFRRAIRLLLVAAVLVWPLWPGGIPSAEPASGPAGTDGSGRTRVLVVQSYDPGYLWPQSINQGIADALRGQDVTIETIYLDAKRHADPARLRQAAAGALRRIEAEHVAVVIAVDDPAQEYLVAPRLMGRARPQVIFCGVNAPLQHYGYPAGNVSGVQERWHFRQGFELLAHIAPSLRRVVFLTEDSESGRYVREDLLERQRQGGPYALAVVGAETIRTFQQWQARVLWWQDHTDALALGIYNALVDETTGRVVPAKQVMAWTNAVNHLPTLGFSDLAREYGLLCGVLESGHEQGYLAGVMVRELLVRGVPAGRLPPRVNSRGVVLLNLRAAERLGLHISFELIEAAGVVLQ